MMMKMTTIRENPPLYPSGNSSQAIPAKQSAPDPVESSKPAKQPAQKKPAPKKKAAPVPASSQKNPPAKPRKPVKSPEYIDSTDEYEEDNAKVAVQGEIRRPKGRTLSDFEGYCGMFFFSFIEKINKVNIYFLANRFFKIDRQLKDIKDANQSHV